MDATTVKPAGPKVHINDEAKKDGVITFISWSNPWLQKAIADAAWLKENERATDIFVNDDGISVKIETVEKVVIQPMRI